MRRRSFLSTRPAGALLAGAALPAGARTSPVPRSVPAAPSDPFAVIGPGDRITGPKFVGLSTVWAAAAASEMRKDRLSLAC